MEDGFITSSNNNKNSRFPNLLSAWIPVDLVLVLVISFSCPNQQTNELRETDKARILNTSIL